MCWTGLEGGLIFSEKHTLKGPEFKPLFRMFALDFDVRTTWTRFYDL